MLTVGFRFRHEALYLAEKIWRKLGRDQMPRWNTRINFLNKCSSLHVLWHETIMCTKDSACFLLDSALPPSSSKYVKAKPQPAPQREEKLREKYEISYLCNMWMKYCRWQRVVLANSNKKNNMFFFTIKYLRIQYFTVPPAQKSYQLLCVRTYISILWPVYSIFYIAYRTFVPWFA